MNKKKNLTTKETFTLAVQNHQKNNLQVAEKLYKETLKTNPNHIETIFLLGSLSAQTNNFDKAKKFFKKVIQINPNHVTAHNNLGNTLKELGELKKAIDCYQKAIQINPNHVNAYNNLRIIFLELGEFESSYNNHIKFLQLKSEGTVSNAKLENVIPKLAKKLQHQNGIPTFFDNAVHSQLTKKNNPTSDYCDVFEKGQLSKENRFISYSERVRGFSKSVPTSRLFHGLPFLVSQGVHSLIKWKEIPLYKTAFDLTIYSMILQEVKPDVIIELGSGSGGSAIWLADTAIALGLDTHVYSFDINKPLINHDKVTFIEHDLSKINKQHKPPCWELFTGKKIIIEDVHVNLKDILYLFDTILKKDDYLIIEDSEEKQDIISHFSTEKEPKYKLDQFFIDFFGTNITCCVNSIFKCY